MANFGSHSMTQYATLDPRLQNVLHEAIKYYDFTILVGYRNEEDQNHAFAEGLSTKKWPDSTHNVLPSRGVDLSPYPADWSDKKEAIARFAILAGVMKVSAAICGVKIRWGADWNRNWDPRDEKFLDWGHFEVDE